MARYTDTFAFFNGVTRERATIGHFFGVLGAPFYVVGVYHIYLMLRPAHETGMVRTYINDGTGHFTNTANPNSDFPSYPMGIGIVDLNNDGLTDYCFTDEAEALRIADCEFAWGMSYEDLIVSQTLSLRLSTKLQRCVCPGGCWCKRRRVKWPKLVR